MFLPFPKSPLFLPAGVPVARRAAFFSHVFSCHTLETRTSVVMFAFFANTCVSISTSSVLWMTSSGCTRQCLPTITISTTLEQGRKRAACLDELRRLGPVGVNLRIPMRLDIVECVLDISSTFFVAVIPQPVTHNPDRVCKYVGLHSRHILSASF